MSRPRLLPARDLTEVVEYMPAYRQSILSKADNCALSTRFDLEGSSFTNAAQARGIIFHRFASEYLRTLRDTGETSMSSEEAMVILYEVTRQRDVPAHEVVVVPVRERRILRICAIRLASEPLNMKRLIEVERKLETKLSYVTDQGQLVERVISGTPDALLADPPAGATVLDWKTSPSAPAPVPKNDDGTDRPPHWTGDHLHVSPEGYFQQRVYALLVMDNYPSINQVTLKEFYPLPKEARNATVPREALEHIRLELALIVEFLDRGLMEGSSSPLWAPSPGLHCGYCRRPTACPIEQDARVVEGGITSDAQAAKAAGEFVAADSARDALRKALKNYHDVTGRPIPIKDAKGRHDLRWGVDSKGKRSFKLHTPDRDVRDTQLDGAFDDAASRRKAG